MTLRNWMIIKAIVCIVFGVVFVLIPAAGMSIFGVALTGSGVLMTRFFGQAFIILALLLWLARNTAEASTRRAFGLAILVGDAIGFVIALIAQLSGMFNAAGWVIVALYLILTLAFGSFIVRKPAA